MLKIEAILQPSKLDAVKDALLEAGIEGMTILEARGHGRQKGHTEFYRGREYTVDLLPKVKIETGGHRRYEGQGHRGHRLGAARTGRIGDGKIFVSRIDEAIRIRNDERGENRTLGQIQVQGLRTRRNRTQARHFIRMPLFRARGVHYCVVL